MKILWLTTDWKKSEYRTKNNLYGGLGYYRGYKPAQVLKKWHDVDVIGSEILNWGTKEETFTKIGSYDLVIANYALLTGQEISDLLATVKHFKKKILVDIDDNFPAIRDDNPASATYKNGAIGTVGAFLSLADGVIVSTLPLKKVYKKWNKNIDVFPNCNDVNDWPVERQNMQDDKIRIGFAGGLSHKKDLEMILEPMAYILAKYPNVIFQVIGALNPVDAMDMATKMYQLSNVDVSERFMVRGGTEAWHGYPELLNSFAWDIAIAPSIDDEFNKCKSHNRWMESTMIGCPVVASPVYPNITPIQGRQVIRHGVTGVLAKNSEEWFEMLSGLIENPDKRKEIAKNAYDYITKEWQWSNWEKEFKKIIDKYAI